LRRKRYRNSGLCGTGWPLAYFRIQNRADWVHPHGRPRLPDCFSRSCPTGASSGAQSEDYYFAAGENRAPSAISRRETARWSSLAFNLFGRRESPPMPARCSFRSTHLKNARIRRSLRQTILRQLYAKYAELRENARRVPRPPRRRQCVVLARPAGFKMMVQGSRRPRPRCSWSHVIQDDGGWQPDSRPCPSPSPRSRHAFPQLFVDVEFASKPRA